MSGSYQITAFCGTTGTGGGEGSGEGEGEAAKLGRVGVLESHAPHKAIAIIRRTPSPLRWRPRINLISI
jgi:hypothetical protein